MKAREEVLVAGESADDPYALRDLDYIYVLGYAVDHWLLMGGEIYDRSYITGYTSSIEDAPGADSMIWMAREYVDTFKKIIDPAHYGSGIAPQPVIEGVYDGVYYEDLVFPEDDPHEISLTQFHWEYDGYYCFMKVKKELMDYIRANDPEALKGPLFELRKVYLDEDAIPDSPSAPGDASVPASAPMPR